jgi:fumarate hydratase class II
MNDRTRTETDSLGTIDIPEDRLWGPQTERARRASAAWSASSPGMVSRVIASAAATCITVGNMSLEDWPRFT